MQLTACNYISRKMLSIMGDWPGNGELVKRKAGLTETRLCLTICFQIVRWTAKTNQLSEQFKNVDVDEYKRMKEEKKQFQQQIASLKTDNQRVRTQTESLKSELSKSQGELVGLKVELEFYSEQRRHDLRLTSTWKKKGIGFHMLWRGRQKMPGLNTLLLWLARAVTVSL